MLCRFLTDCLFACLFSREVVVDLIEEYKAAERMDYVNWGSSSSSATAAGDLRDPASASATA